MRQCCRVALADGLLRVPAVEKFHRSRDDTSTCARIFYTNIRLLYSLVQAPTDIGFNKCLRFVFDFSCSPRLRVVKVIFTHTHTHTYTVARTSEESTSSGLRPTLFCPCALSYYYCYCSVAVVVLL